MPIETRIITDREEWLKWRGDDVTASVAGALLGLHPHCTALQLYMAKTGLVSLDNGDSGPMRRGRLLEPVAMQIVKEAHPEWQVEAPAVYLRDPEHKLGCTPDLYASTSLSRCVIEIKSVEPSAFRRNWLDESGTIQVPTWIAIQALVCAHLAQAQWCMVGVLRVAHGIEFDLIPIPETPGLIARIEAAASEFWACVERGEPPPPVFPADTDSVLKMASKAADEGASVEIEEGDNYFPALIAEYVQNGVELREREARGKAIKAELLHKLGEATTLKQNGRTLATAKLVTKKAEEKPRAGYSYRDLRIPPGAVP